MEGSLCGVGVASGVTTAAGVQGIVECGTLAYWGLVAAPVPLIAAIVWKAGNDLADRSAPCLAIFSCSCGTHTSADGARLRCLQGVHVHLHHGSLVCARPHSMAMCGRHEDKERLGFEFVEGDLMWTRRCARFRLAHFGLTRFTLTRARALAPGFCSGTLPQCHGVCGARRIRREAGPLTRAAQERHLTHAPPQERAHLSAVHHYGGVRGWRSGHCSRHYFGPDPARNGHGPAGPLPPRPPPLFHSPLSPLHPPSRLRSPRLNVHGWTYVSD
jgi:hypothetical protein